jgi:hypothetical protein
MAWTPKQVPDFIALRGDPSDKVPGAPGVGATGAATLLQRYGSLEAALEAGWRPPARLGFAVASTEASRVPPWCRSGGCKSGHLASPCAPALRPAVNPSHSLIDGLASGGAADPLKCFWVSKGAGSEILMPALFHKPLEQLLWRIRPLAPYVSNSCIVRQNLPTGMSLGSRI